MCCVVTVFPLSNIESNKSKCCPALPGAWMPANAGTHAEPVYPGIIFPDRADASRRRLGGRAECWNERHRARLASLRAGDGAHRDIERGKLGRWRRTRRGWQASHAQHGRVSRPDRIFFWAKWNHGKGSRIYNSLLAISKLRYIHGVLSWPK